MFAAIIIIVHREERKETHVYLVFVKGQALCLHSAQLILCNSQDNSRKVVLYQRRRKGFKSIRDVPRVTPLWGTVYILGTWMDVHYMDLGKVGRWGHAAKGDRPVQPRAPGVGAGTLGWKEWLG